VGTARVFQILEKQETAQKKIGVRPRFFLRQMLKKRGF